MFVSARGSVLGLLYWQWRLTTVFVISGALVAAAHQLLHLHWFTLPTTPVLVVGGALAIFVSFRTNSAYDRWWEGRKLWGQLVNSSRHFADQVVTYVGRGAPVDDLQRALVLRHAAYVHALRCALRQQDLAADEDLRRLLPADELAAFAARSNPTHALLERQHRELAALERAGRLTGHQLELLDQTVRVLLDVQGGCERIKKTPIPRGYGFIANRLILAYGLLFPISLTEELGWVIIPINVLVSLSFALISEAGRVLEDPFTMFYNGLPLSQLSRMIEVNLREVIGDDDLPEIPQPTADGVLM